MNSKIYNHAQCCLDLSDSDIPILKMAKYFLEKGIIKSIGCIHVVDNDLEESIRRHYDSNTWNELKQEVREDIIAVVDEVFENKVRIQVEVIGGSAVETIDYESQKVLTELIFVGKKIKGNGVISKQLARKSKCDIIFIPEIFNHFPSSTIVAFDFSNHAIDTLKLSLQIAAQLNIKDVNALNIIPSPTGYFQSGRLHKSFLEVEKAESFKKWNHLKKELEIPQLPELTLVENEMNNTTFYIEEMAFKLSNPILFLGSKGKTASTAFLLGSVTEKMINSELSHPILIHKMSDENFDLLDGLFKGMKD
jgi:nucleotide-binding universal stress UspA family protein